MKTKRLKTTSKPTKVQKWTEKELRYFLNREWKKSLNNILKSDKFSKEEKNKRIDEGLKQFLVFYNALPTLSYKKVDETN